MRFKVFSSRPFETLTITALGSSAWVFFTPAIVARTVCDGVAEMMTGRFWRASDKLFVTRIESGTCSSGRRFNRRVLAKDAAALGSNSHKETSWPFSDKRTAKVAPQDPAPK